MILTSISLLSGSLTNLGYLHFYDNFHATKKSPSNSISNINFDNFNHGYYAHIVERHQAQDPEKVDINVNYSEYGGSDVLLKEVILTKLDSRYQYYFNVLYFKNFLQNEGEEQIQFCDPQHDDNAVFNDFNIANLTSLGDIPSLGEWRTFNLKLVYLPNNSSFEFSLNLCDFDLEDYGGSNSINLSNGQQYQQYNLPTMNTWKDIYHEGSPWYFFSTVADDPTHKDVVLNVNQITDLVSGVNVAKFDTTVQAGFFLDPLSYTYAVYMDQWMFGVEANKLSLPSITVQFNLANLQTTSWTDLTTGLSDGTFNTTAVPTDMPYDSVNDPPYGNYFSFSNVQDPDHNPDSYFSNATQWSRGSIHQGVTSDATDVVAYTEEDYPANVEIINAAMSGGDNFIDGYRDFLEFSFKTYGINLTTGFNENVFSSYPEAYQLTPNSIVDYSNFIYFTNQDGSLINMYGYKNDVLNNYYTYAIENSDKANNTLLNFNNQTIDKLTINNKSLASFKAINLQNLIINNQPTLLRIKITPIITESNIVNSLYYGYDDQDSTINFNLIVYPADYSTFHNYIDFNNVDNSLSDYNEDLKIYIDKSLVNSLNINKLNEDGTTGFLDVIDAPWNIIKKSGWAWTNYQGNNICKVLNPNLFPNLFDTLNKYISNPNNFNTMHKTASYIYGLIKCLTPYLNQNICFNIKFRLDDHQFSPSSIYNNFRNLGVNDLFYEQIIGLGGTSAK